jgi:hypothetical protein
MGTPTVPFQVLARGYRIRSGRDNGLVAEVPYLVAWSDAFTFADEVIGYPSAASVGPIIYTDAYRFPPCPKLMAIDADIEPCGCDGSALAANKGLSPGEFFTHAKVTVIFGTPQYPVSVGGAEDPNNLNQLDPDNPITYCEQAVKLGGRAVVVKGVYDFDSSGQQVKGPVTVIETEAEITLTFPKIPFLPWKKIKPYLGRLNSVKILDCDRGTLLFEGSDIRANSTSQGLLSQQCMLTFSYNEHGWNSQYDPSLPGYDTIHRRAEPSKSVYEYANFSNLFL